MKKYNTPSVMVLLGLLALGVPAHAQDVDINPGSMINAVSGMVDENVIPINPPSEMEMGDANNKTLAPEQLMLQQVAEDMKAELERLDKIDRGVPSLFFNQQEREWLAQALYNYDNDIDISSTNEGEGEAAIPYVPNVVLNGIFYQSDKKWIVWINNTRIEPGKMLPEMKSIKVNKEYVEIEWTDVRTQEILPIRLRPNQRFNVDSKIFFPS